MTDLTLTPPGPRRQAARSPLMEQYRRIKDEQPDAFLFFRLGDFYEMFFEDAVEGAALLGLTLTSRNKQDPDPIPMCGLPWHQRDAYVAKLLRLGRKVAICDQLEDAATAKGLVARGVSEIFTPGSVTGDSFLEPTANNFLAAIWPTPERVGLCLADASTGETRLVELPWEEAADLLAGIAVAEIVQPDAAADPKDEVGRLLRDRSGLRTQVPASAFLDLARLCDRWGAEAEALVRDLPVAAAAAAGALAYLDRVQGGRALVAPRIVRLAEERTLRYDVATARHLELFQPQPGGEPAHTLWHHLNLCVSGPGSRRLRGWLESPLADLLALRRRQERVQDWIDAARDRGSFREALRGFPDLERLASRLALGRATPRDLGALRDGLERLPAIAPPLQGRRGRSLEAGEEIARGLPDLAATLARALVESPPLAALDGGILQSGYDEERDRLHDLARSGKRWIAELEAQERLRTGITSLKVGFNRVFGYYLEVTRPHLDKVPADYERRQTLTGAERFVTTGLKQKESEVLGAEQKLEAREHEVFLELRALAARHVPELQRIAGALAAHDAEAALAEAAARYDWTRPAFDDSQRIALREARHPVVERLLPRGEFVPNGLELDRAGRQILLLTGPNMGGKSTYLRQIALCVLLAQTGSWVPAAVAEIGLVDRLFTRVGASDRLGAGQSTFLVEMKETADILRGATARSLVLLDEIGRGTATYDGLAIAWAVTEHLHGSEARPRTIFATHYHELTQLARELPGVANVNVAVKEHEGGVVFLHRIVEGAADRSYGIHVAQLAGLPEAVLERAREVLAELESERTIDHLQAAGQRPSGESAAKVASQQALFTLPHPLERALDELELEQLTPLAALNLLAEWKARRGG